MKDDKTIARIREIRKRISARFGHNVEKMVKHYIKTQAKRKYRLITSVHV